MLIVTAFNLESPLESPAQSQIPINIPINKHSYAGSLTSRGSKPTCLPCIVVEWANNLGAKMMNYSDIRYFYN